MYTAERVEASMAIRIDISVDVDDDAILNSAKILMGPSGSPDRATVELRISEAIKRVIKSNVPHILSVRDFDHKDC
jgi:hypothetical protein